MLVRAYSKVDVAVADLDLDLLACWCAAVLHVCCCWLLYVCCRCGLVLVVSLPWPIGFGFAEACSSAFGAAAMIAFKSVSSWIAACALWPQCP
jgi:hypothetical protein